MAAVYISLGLLRANKGIAAGKTSDDALLRHYIRQASSLWERWTQRTFVPQVATRLFKASQTDDLSLAVDDLLAVTTLTNGDGQAVTAANYWLEPDNGYPKTTISLKESSGLSWEFTYGDSRITVAGIFGYHNNYSNAWGNSLDTVEDNPLSPSVTTLTVNDADGLDDRGLTRFEELDYLLVEDEQMQVVSINAPANTLTVNRGVNGTTTTSHAQNTVIKVYRQMDDVLFGVGEISKWLYEHRDTTNKGVQLAEGLGVVIVRELPEVKALADSFVPDWYVAV